MSCEKGLAHKVELKARIDPSSRKHLIAAQVVSCASSSNLGPGLTNRLYFLALQTSAGWFVRYLGEDGTVCGFEMAVSVRYRPHSLRTTEGRVQLFLAPNDAKDPPSLCCSIADGGMPVCGANGLCE
jgi:hypothetical protein